MSEVDVSYSKGAFDLWKDFTLAMIMLMLPIIISNFIASIYYPIIAIILSLIIFTYVRLNRKYDNKSLKCLLGTFIIGRTLFLYGIIIAILNIVELSTSSTLYFNDFPILLISPILAVYSLFPIKRKCVFCKLCIIHYGFPSERNMFGKIQGQEMKKVIVQFLYIAILLTIVEWGYYLFIYNPINVSNYDILIFSGLPIIICIIQDTSLAIRCLTISLFKKAIFGNFVFKQNKSYIRFLVISKDEILLLDDINKGWDTPITLYTPFQSYYGNYAINSILSNKFNIVADEVRFMYKDIDNFNNCGIWHFLCFIDKKDTITNNGKWITTQELESLYSHKKLSWTLKNEMSRILTTIMSIKMFNDDGSRKYSFKDYYPSFHISDIKDLKIDFTDNTWMLLALKNEYGMSSFFKKIWYKYIEGIID